MYTAQKIEEHQFLQECEVA